jgi:hypothetical protein
LADEPVSSNVPQCALAIEDILRRAGCSRGRISKLLIGPELAPRTIDDRRVKAVTLTGSEPAGRQVASPAAQIIAAGFESRFVDAMEGVRVGAPRALPSKSFDVRMDLPGCARMVFTDDNCFGYAVVNGLAVRMDEVLHEAETELQCGRAVAQSPFDAGPQGQVIVMK